MLVNFKNISKYYAYGQKHLNLSVLYKPNTFKLESDYIVALDNISFCINKGEALGIIGRNGSGKSTLLQIIAGTLSPTSGSLNVNGRIGALLELGSGFNPEFTGIENIYLSGSILGIPRDQMDTKLKDIEAFADIGDFINQPVKTYSTGMLMRVAFAVAVAIEPDLLIIDEALSVGDIIFQQKCNARLKDLLRKGVSLLVVTHDTSFVLNMCDRALWLHKGKQMYLGNASDCVQRYLSAMASISGNSTDFIESIDIKPSKNIPNALSLNLDNVTKLGSKVVRISKVWVLNDKRDYSTTYTIGTWCEVIIELISSNYVDNVSAGLEIKDRHGQVIFATGLRVIKQLITHLDHNESRLVSIKFQLNIAPGQYTLDVGCGSGLGTNNTGYRLVAAAIIDVVLNPADDIVHGLVKLPYSINVY